MLETRGLTPSSASNTRAASASPFALLGFHFLICDEQPAKGLSSRAVLCDTQTPATCDHVNRNENERKVNIQLLSCPSPIASAQLSHVVSANHVRQHRWRTIPASQDGLSSSAEFYSKSREAPPGNLLGLRNLMCHSRPSESKIGIFYKITPVITHSSSRSSDPLNFFQLKIIIIINNKIDESGYLLHKVLEKEINNQLVQILIH